MIKISLDSAIQVSDFLNGMLDGGTLVIYSGAEPASVDVALTTQTDLVSFDLENPAFDPAAAGGNGARGALVLPPAVPATASDTATFFRIYDLPGDARVQGSVTDSPTPGAGDLRVPTTTVVAGVSVAIISLNLGSNT